MIRQERQGVVDVIGATSPLNRDAQPALEDVGETCLAHGTGQIVFDFREVSLIDSAGLEMLMDLQDRCLRRGGALKIAAPNHLCREVIRVTGLDDCIEVFPDVVVAVGSFAK